MSIDTEELLSLIDLVSQERISDLRLNRGNLHIHIQLHGEKHHPAPHPTGQAVAATPSLLQKNAAAHSGANATQRTEIKAPMAGTFYRAASTDSPPLVQIGQQVTTLSRLGLMEAMKMMHDITAPSAGTVTRILVDNGQTVDAGQVLFELETAS